jgi:ABC-2 type transport system permease protein
VPIVGSLWLLAAAALLFLVGMLGQGLLISVVTKSQQLATQFGFLSALLPTMLLSGFLFPIQNMPRLLQLVSALIPARYFIAILRGILLKGNGGSALWSEFLALGLFATAMIAVSTARFRRRLD